MSTRLRDYASQEEIDTAIDVVQQARRELIVMEKQPAVRCASKAVRDNVALAALWATADRCRLNRLLTDLRRGEMPSNLEDRMIALPKAPARELLLQLHVRYQACLRGGDRGASPAVGAAPLDDAAWDEHLRWMALTGVRAREWLLPGEKQLSSSARWRLISERQDRFLAAHPERLEAVRRKAEDADGAKRGS